MSYFGVWFVVYLLQRSVVRHLVTAIYLCRMIQTSKADLINRKYQIMIVNMLKNWSRRYSSHYIIKFVNFMSIYYVINLDIVSSYMIFIYLYLGSIDLLL